METLLGRKLCVGFRDCSNLPPLISLTFMPSTKVALFALLFNRTSCDEWQGATMPWGRVTVFGDSHWWSFVRARSTVSWVGA